MKKPNSYRDEDDSEEEDDDHDEDVDPSELELPDEQPQVCTSCLHLCLVITANTVSATLESDQMS